MASASYRRDVTEFDSDGLCRQHHSPMRRYCKQCSEAACDECVIAHHFKHDESVVLMSKYAQEVKQNTTELLALASNLPFFRIKYAAERTRCISGKRRDELSETVDRRARLVTADLQNSVDVLDAMAQRVVQLGSGALNDENVNQEETTPAEYMEIVDTVMGMFNENSPALGLEFVGMRPDGSVGNFITGKINIIGNVVNGQTITYIADNRKHDSVIIIGSGHPCCESVSKWNKSFRVIDQQNPLVFSSQVLSEAEEKLLLIALGYTIYKIDTSVGRCISEQIDTIYVKEGAIPLEEASSISGIDWFPENDGSLAVVSFNIGKSLYLFDMDTKVLVRSFSTVLNNPSVISGRKVGNHILTMTSDNTHPFKLVVINEKGSEEFRLTPSERIIGYRPCIGCWVGEDTSIKIAVVWWKPTPHHWRIMMHDRSGGVIQELGEHGSGTTTPISIACNHLQKYITYVCSKEGIHHIPVTY